MDVHQFLNRIRNTFRQSLATKQGIFTFILFIYYGFAFFSPGKKAFILLSFLLLVAVYILLNDLVLSLSLSYLATSYFHVGQIYQVQIINPRELFFTTDYIDGRSLFFVLSPKFMLGIGIVLSALYKSIFGRGSYRLPLESVLFGFLIVLQLLASFHSSYYQSLSVLYSVESLMVFAWLFILISRPKLHKVREFFYRAIVLSFSLQFLVVILQFIKRGPLGILIEQKDRAIAPELGVDFFRPFGLEGHPNLLARSMLFGLFMSTIYLLTKKGKSRVAKIALIGSFVSLILSQSRAGYLGLMLGTLPFVILYFKRIKDFALSGKWVRKPTILIILPLTILVSIVVPARIFNTFIYSFSESGAFGVRKQLILESISIIRERPLLGVGKGMFIPAAFNRNSTGVMSWFPEPVHNEFLLVTAESGLLAGLIVFLIYYLIIRKAFYGEKNKIIAAGVSGFILSQIIFIFFHAVNDVASAQIAFSILLIDA